MGFQLLLVNARHVRLLPGRKTNVGGRLRKKLPQLRQALRGRSGEHHGLLVGLALDHLQHLEAAIARLAAHLDEVLAPVRGDP